VPDERMLKVLGAAFAVTLIVLVGAIIAIQTGFFGPGEPGDPLPSPTPSGLGELPSPSVAPSQSVAPS